MKAKTITKCPFIMPAWAVSSDVKPSARPGVWKQQGLEAYSRKGYGEEFGIPEFEDAGLKIIAVQG